MGGRSIRPAPLAQAKAGNAESRVQKSHRRGGGAKPATARSTRIDRKVIKSTPSDRARTPYGLPMVEYERMAVAPREHGSAVAAQRANATCSTLVGAVIDDWDVQSTGEMILAWGEASLDSSIVVSFPRGEQQSSGGLDEDFFDWCLSVGHDDAPSAEVGLDLSAPGSTPVVLPRPRDGHTPPTTS